MAAEVIAGTAHAITIMPVLQHTLVEAGVYLIENLATEHLASVGIPTFYFILLPGEIQGYDWITNYGGLNRLTNIPPEIVALCARS